MELQIQNLVSSIRKEGIEAANKEAEAIIAEAKKKADKAVAEEVTADAAATSEAEEQQEWRKAPAHAKSAESSKKIGWSAAGSAAGNGEEAAR